MVWVMMGGGWGRLKVFDLDAELVGLTWVCIICRMNMLAAWRMAIFLGGYGVVLMLEFLEGKYKGAIGVLQLR